MNNQFLWFFLLKILLSWLDGGKHFRSFEEFFPCFGFYCWTKRWLYHNMFLFLFLFLLLDLGVGLYFNL